MNFEEAEPLLDQLLQNNAALCPLLFDEENRLYPEPAAKLYQIAEFGINLMRKYLPAFRVKDILLCGSITSYIYNSKTDVDVGVLVDFDHSSLSDAQKQILCNSASIYLRSCGYDFRILNRRVDLGFVYDFHAGSGQYSLLANAWIAMPEKRDFSFSKQEFFSAYCNLSAEAHDFVRQLPMTDQSFLTYESAEKLDRYLDQLKTDALAAKKYMPEKEYCLNYQLYRCLKRMGVILHFREYARDSFNYLIDYAEDEVA